MTSSNVAAALRELEVAGLIFRQKDPGDARRVRLSVTERGSVVVADFRRERDTWFGRAVEAVLSPDEQRVLMAAGQLLQRLAEYEQAVLTNPATTDEVRTKLEQPAFGEAGQQRLTSQDGLGL